MALRALLRKRLTRPSIRRPFYFLLGGRSTAPHSVGIELSHRCNLRCRTCWLYGENGTGAKFVKDELSAKEVKNLIDQIARHHCDFYIGGSEPYIRRDFPEILQYAKEKGLRVAFTTNGVLPDQSQLERLIAIGTDSVNFSIDGGEELHDQLRGPGVFCKVVSSVKELRRRRDKAQSIRPSIFINTVISAGILGRIEHEIGSIIKATEDGAD
jgi:MoaA/NifB/PqqE/SkfB family radical SAM enzyme